MPQHIPLVSPMGRVLSRVATWCRDVSGRRDDVDQLRITADDVRPPVPAAYMPLYTYLERRHAVTVVLTFEQIEALLGFVPPAPAFSDAAWWADTDDRAVGRHVAAWTAARRSAMPQMQARIVAFERQP